jgi:hypothetical protein
MNARLTKTVLFITLLMTIPLHARSPQQTPSARLPQQLPTTRSPQENLAAQHCVAQLEQLAPGIPDSRISSVDCYPSFSEAIYAATNGAVLLPPDESFRAQLKALRRELKSIANKATSGSGPVIIAIDYVDSIYRGALLSKNGTRKMVAIDPSAWPRVS